MLTRIFQALLGGGPRVVLALLLVIAAGHVSAQPQCEKGSTLNIVAHEDDDILFLSPDLLHDIQAGRCVRTVFVTAGDDGKGLDYAARREEGAEAAYASMAKHSDIWDPAEVKVEGVTLRAEVLHDDPSISLVFIGLPDGDRFGEGFASNGHESLKKLVKGEISPIHSIDHKMQFSKASLQATIAALIVDFRPDQLRAQDYLRLDPDHSDHKAVGRMVRDAEKHYLMPHTYTAYLDDLIMPFEANLTEADIKEKRVTFKAYADHDSEIGCYESAGNIYYYWLDKEYIARIRHYPSKEKPYERAKEGLQRALARLGGASRYERYSAIRDAPG